MEIMLNIALIILLGLAFFQDNKGRSIHLLLLIALGAVNILLFAQTTFSWNIVLLNALFTITVLVLLVLYLSLKEGRLVNIFKTHFGLGDLVFLLAITPLFSNRNFILFFITGIVFSGCTHVLMSQLKRTGETVPLAGYLAIYLIALKVVGICTNMNVFYNDLI
ncbi:MAG: hypothetical protein HUJ25_17870 [Crocinitomicaceae bacterium]|nr:hypothetical protein [Crocinitomicaceae bacterium]